MDRVLDEESEMKCHTLLTVRSRKRVTELEELATGSYIFDLKSEKKRRRRREKPKEKVHTFRSCTLLQIFFSCPERSLEGLKGHFYRRYDVSMLTLRKMKSEREQILLLLQSCFMFIKQKSTLLGKRKNFSKSSSLGVK